MIQIAPSLLAADFSRLGEEIREVDDAGADLIHVDVMDGHFVPNITLGPLVVEAIRPHTSLPLDVHLMIEQPDRYIPAFAAAGANMISVHVEACVHLHRTLTLIRESGARPGVVLNPATPESSIEPALDWVDYVLVMTINPGFGGQTLIPDTLKKIRRIRDRLDAMGRRDVPIEVDGGVSPATIRSVVEAGAELLVAGTAVFGQPDRASAIRALREHAGA